MKRNGLKMVLFGLILLSAVSGVVMLLWNLLLPGLFGLATINFWQAAGLFILARILLGSFGFGGRRAMMMGMGGHMDHHHHGMGNPMHEKWMKMTPEQRREFIEKRRKFGFGGHFGRDRSEMDEQEEPRKENE